MPGNALERQSHQRVAGEVEKPQDLPNPVSSFMASVVLVKEPVPVRERVGTCPH
jgi:hypothetical protein